MATLNFESIPGLTIAGTVNVVEGIPPMPQPNVPPTGVLSHIRTDQPFQFDFNWSQSGWLSCLICGTYQVEICFEECGSGEFSPSPASMNVAMQHGNGTSYNTSLSYAAGSVPAGHYKVIACLILLDNAGNPAPVAGFVDLGLIKFYEYQHC